MSGWREEAAWAVALAACVPVLIGAILMAPVAALLGWLLGD